MPLVFIGFLEIAKVKIFLFQEKREMHDSPYLKPGFEKKPERIGNIRI